MSPNPKLHRREVWDQFWRQNQRIEQVYSNSDRVLSQLRNLGAMERKKILEVGAGSGRDGVALCADGAVVIMLDYSDPALRVIQSLAIPNQHPVHLIRGDAFRLPLKTNSIDVVFHQGLLEHFTNPRSILAENHRVLRTGGYALADVPQRYHVYTAIKHVLMMLNKWFAGWETEFSVGQLKVLFRQAGFSVDHVYGDWMRPSLFYRALRQMLKTLHQHLPLYPKPLPGVTKLRSLVRRKIRRSSLAFYTYMDIGVIGKKTC